MRCEAAAVGVVTVMAISQPTQRLRQRIARNQVWPAIYSAMLLSGLLLSAISASVEQSNCSKGRPMSAYDLDAADRRILRELQQDGALRNDILSERVSL